MSLRYLLLIVGSCVLLAVIWIGFHPLQPGQGRFSPQQRPFSQQRMNQLRLPAGFTVNVFAQGLDNPRIIRVGSEGVIYISQPQSGQVTALWDRNNDGKADDRKVVVSGIASVHGIAIRKDKIYLASPTRLFVANIQNDGTLGKPRVIIQDLPSGRGHLYRTLGFGPDGYLYLSVGSTSNDKPESNPEHASILQMKEDGSGRSIFASGLRNTEGFDWHPTTHQLWGMDHGSDNRGDNLPPEELNHLMKGRNYGWPYCYGKRQIDEVTSARPSGMTREQFCAKSEPSVLGYQAHSSPIQLMFYTGKQFPAGYRNDAFVTFRGSWNRSSPVGYKVVCIRFNAQGQPTGFEDFMTGFLIEGGKAQFARLAGLAQLTDGSILVGDDENGVIYRVTYRAPK